MVRKLFFLGKAKIVTVYNLSNRISRLSRPSHLNFNSLDYTKEESLQKTKRKDDGSRQNYTQKFDDGVNPVAPQATIYRVIIKSLYTLKLDISKVPGTRKMALVANERGRMGVLCRTHFFMWHYYAMNNYLIKKLAKISLFFSLNKKQRLKCKGTL
jgi:hypothetical protein